LVLLHGWLLWRLVVFVGSNHRDQPDVVQLLFPLAMLLPTLYGAAHMRYLIPIIPLLLLMAFGPAPVCGWNAAFGAGSLRPAHRIPREN
jgi:hypothetical protein